MTRNRILDTSNRARRRKMRVRKDVRGTADCPRLSVFRSNRHIYAQLINDDDGRSLVAVSTLSAQFRANSPGGRPATVESAREVGKLVAGKARSLGIEKVVFDRGAYMYHGRVRALAEGAREGGLKF